MNDTNFCHKLYNDIIKTYQDTFAYRITTDEDNPYKSKIEYIPVGFSEHIDNIKALDGISSYARFSLNKHLFKINAEVYTKESGESSLELYVYSDLKTVCYNLSNDKWYLENGNVKKKIIIFSKNDVYSMSNINCRYYPTSFKDLNIFPKELISVLLPYFTESYIWKDFINDKVEIPNTPLKHLKMPKEFVLLNTQKALIDEGKINHNCVGGYGKVITSGKCVVYSANIQNEHLTIEIRLRKLRNSYKFYVSQCYKAYNKPCSEDVLAYVNECLKKCSDKAITKYLKTIERK